MQRAFAHNTLREIDKVGALVKSEVIQNNRAAVTTRKSIITAGATNPPANTILAMGDIRPHIVFAPTIVSILQN